MNEKQTASQSEAMMKQGGQRGMRYFRYMYRVKCPFKALGCIIFALAYAAMAIFLLASGAVPMGVLLLLIPLFCGLEAAIGIVTAVRFRRCEREGTYTRELYRITQGFIWGGGVTWCVIMGVYAAAMMIQDGRGAESAAGIPLMVVFCMLPSLLRFLYFKNRKDLYGAGEQKQGLPCKRR
jgi:hypothetical protein